MPLKEWSWKMQPPGRTGAMNPWTWRVSSKFVLSAVGLWSKLWIEWMNKVKVHNTEGLQEAFERRCKDQGLLTVSNHTSCIDDPLLWGTLKTRQLVSDKMRFTSAAEDICFRSWLPSLFFSLGKVFPIVRGDGVYQKGMDFMVKQLDFGQWCHIFPEGKVNMTQEFMRLKWGVGRVIADCKITPMVLPMWHVGMETVLPNSKPYIPQIRKHVTLLIGQPMDFASEIEFLKSSKKTPMEIRKYITDKIQEEFHSMKEVAETLHKELLSSS